MRKEKNLSLWNVADATDEIVKTVQDLQEGDTLLLGGNELHFYPEKGLQKEYWISNNAGGMKSIVFPLLGKKNITIDGQGAKLIFHGEVLPFVVDQCENITIKNLSIDYAEPMCFAARITDSGEDFVEMEYDPAMYHCDVQDQALRFYGENWENINNTVLVNEFDGETKGPVPQTPTYVACFSGRETGGPNQDLYRYVTPTKTGENRLRLVGKLGYRHQVGKYWVCTHRRREHPGVFCNDSRNIQITDVKLVHTRAMGVICQLCENVTLNGVVAVPGEGRILSTNADATHFVNCTGLIHLKNCRLESMMDDAVNVHGIYMPIAEKLSDCSLRLRFGHSEQRGVNIFKIGDKIRLVNHETFESVCNLTVKNSRMLSSESILLETEEVLPTYIPDGYVVENHSRMPEVHIENCRTGYNRPRGFLLATNRDALVENCTFYNLSCAIVLTGDARSWFESGAGGKVILRNNCFDNAAYAGGTVIRTKNGIQRAVGQTYYDSLIVENNHFRTNGKRFLALSYVGNVVFRGNTFCQDDSLRGGRTLGEDGFDLRECGIVEIEKI